MNSLHNPRLTANAKDLRKSMTKEERHLWFDCLKGLPAVFHRQKTIGSYIVDFYCASAKLVIELDGSQHYDAKGIKTDIKRDAFLHGLGLTVKRYSNADINNRFSGVCEDIYSFILLMQNTSSGRHIHTLKAALPQYSPNGESAPGAGERRLPSSRWNGLRRPGGPHRCSCRRKRPPAYAHGRP